MTASTALETWFQSVFSLIVCIDIMYRNVLMNMIKFTSVAKTKRTQCKLSIPEIEKCLVIQVAVLAHINWAR